MESCNIFHFLRKSSLDDFNKMIDDGISPSSCNEDGESLLALSIKYNNFEAFESLIQRSANIYTTDILKNNLLHIAAMYPHGLEYIKYLVVLGLFPNSRNIYKERPSDVAKRYHNTNVYTNMIKIERSSELISELWS